MSETQVQIVNRALAELGQNPITTIDDDIRTARFAKQAWAGLRDELLRLHPWNFAIKRITLGENLLTYSEEFDNAAWVNSNSSETANAAYAPNGELIADTLTDASGSAGTLTQTVTITDDDVNYCFSVYLKKGTASATTIELALSGGSTADSESMTVTWGTNPTVDTGTIESIGDGWYRLSITLANNSSGHTSMLCRIYPSSSTAASTGTCYAWGAQLSRHTSAIGYSKTTSAASRPVIPNHGYSRGFSKPSDFIRLVKPEDETLPFKLEGSYLYTDEDSIPVEYVYQCTDTSLWDSQFTNIMVYRLAAHLAKPLTGDMAMAGAMMRMTAYYMNEATHVDSKENQQPTETIDGYTYLEARLS